MKKIIVTGGLGIIGSNLIELLLKKNFHVINIDKGTYSSNLYNTKNFIKSKKYKYIKLAENIHLKYPLYNFIHHLIFKFNEKV